MLVERNAATTRHPKMDITNGRSMELFRRLGLVDKLRAVAVPEENNFDISWITSIMGPRTASLSLSRVVEKRAEIRARERRHPAARARHGGQPGDDRAGAAAAPSSATRWSRRAGAWRSRRSRPGRRRASPRTLLRIVETGATETRALRFPRRLRRRFLDRARTARHYAVRATRRSRSAT